MCPRSLLPADQQRFLESLFMYRTATLTRGNQVIHCHFDVLTINMIGYRKSIYRSCKSPYIQIILRLQQKRKMRGGKTTCQGIIVTYTERQIQHMSVPEDTLHSSTGLAMPWERHHDEALAALTRPTLK